ncbi:hypothetical protein O8E88_001351 [Flavobacterium psychrophilum]|uniref:hypothetical protein n=1 Tax=Flavobacterium psychrophilum TaxID=96345 RepID=UPI0004F7694C|nr:hypothetical protein [Flavobacterium psychrophilum]AIN75130.1 hypothetical protein FPG3_06410 [Flavobacterium psychrophilum FPG3]EKT2069550.1 hypothetical protein [Flavobacterium psychrophilum]MBF2044823.1 hypothetical protein [Flavobacterium psychrophilum]OXB11398.1 hypothetical protein B0A57_07585 [Flavobacterium psychrophilum DSM 3660 = ATCC 49418]SCY07097.1 hypothetical protein SAMN02745938_10732 [Flavobacterium psychrophilum DSM 3660] [Flavobacterium psychrophilum DSM 3660 = ATCC 49418
MDIAGKLTIKDWKELAVRLKNEEDENWGLAFHFFEERIRTRYLNPINAILNMDLKTGEGFAVVNLQCSLIETIESFINGWIFSTNPYGWFKNEIALGKNDKALNNQEIFKSFFDKRNPFIELNIRGDEFFKYVRCGLLHETQTKNGWKIRAYGVDKSIDSKIIYRDIFQKDIETVIENYKNLILKNDKITSVELRENFIAKFNHICKVS